MKSIVTAYGKSLSVTAFKDKVTKFILIGSQSLEDNVLQGIINKNTALLESFNIISKTPETNPLVPYLIGDAKDIDASMIDNQNRIIFNLTIQEADIPKNDYVYSLLLADADGNACAICSFAEPFNGLTNTRETITIAMSVITQEDLTADLQFVKDAEFFVTKAEFQNYINTNKNSELVKNTIGDISRVNTINKSSIVAILNEIILNIGNLEEIGTKESASVVEAINYLNNKIGNIEGELIDGADGSIVDALNKINRLIGQFPQGLKDFKSKNITEALNEIKDSIGRVTDSVFADGVKVSEVEINQKVNIDVIGNLDDFQGNSKGSVVECLNELFLINGLDRTKSHTINPVSVNNNYRIFSSDQQYKGVVKVQTSKEAVINSYFEIEVNIIPNTIKIKNVKIDNSLLETVNLGDNLSGLENYTYGLAVIYNNNQLSISVKSDSNKSGQKLYDTIVVDFSGVNLTSVLVSESFSNSNSFPIREGVGRYADNKHLKYTHTMQAGRYYRIIKKSEEIDEGKIRLFLNNNHKLDASFSFISGQISFYNIIDNTNRPSGNENLTIYKYGIMLYEDNNYIYLFNKYGKYDKLELISKDVNFQPSITEFQNKPEGINNALQVVEKPYLVKVIEQCFAYGCVKLYDSSYFGKISGIITLIGTTFGKKTTYIRADISGESIKFLDVNTPSGSRLYENSIYFTHNSSDGTYLNIENIFSRDGYELFDALIIDCSDVNTKPSLEILATLKSNRNYPLPVTRYDINDWSASIGDFRNNITRQNSSEATHMIPVNSILDSTIQKEDTYYTIENYDEYKYNIQSVYAENNNFGINLKGYGAELGFNKISFPNCDFKNNLNAAKHSGRNLDYLSDINMALHLDDFISVANQLDSGNVWIKEAVVDMIIASIRGGRSGTSYYYGLSAPTATSTNFLNYNGSYPLVFSTNSDSLWFGLDNSYSSICEPLNGAVISPLNIMSVMVIIDTYYWTIWDDYCFFVSTANGYNSTRTPKRKYNNGKIYQLCPKSVFINQHGQADCGVKKFLNYHGFRSGNVTVSNDYGARSNQLMFAKIFFSSGAMPFNRGRTYYLPSNYNDTLNNHDPITKKSAVNNLVNQPGKNKIPSPSSLIRWTFYNHGLGELGSSRFIMNARDFQRFFINNENGTDKYKQIFRDTTDIQEFARILRSTPTHTFTCSEEDERNNKRFHIVFHNFRTKYGYYAETKTWTDAGLGVILAEDADGKVMVDYSYVWLYNTLGQITPPADEFNYKMKFPSVRFDSSTNSTDELTLFDFYMKKGMTIKVYTVGWGTDITGRQVSDFLCSRFPNLYDLKTSGVNVNNMNNLPNKNFTPHDILVESLKCNGYGTPTSNLMMSMNLKDYARFFRYPLTSDVNLYGSRLFENHTSLYKNFIYHPDNSVPHFNIHQNEGEGKNGYFWNKETTNITVRVYTHNGSLKVSVNGNDRIDHGNRESLLMFIVVFGKDGYIDAERSLAVNRSLSIQTSNTSFTHYSAKKSEIQNRNHYPSYQDYTSSQSNTTIKEIILAPGEYMRLFKGTGNLTFRLNKYFNLKAVPPFVQYNTNRMNIPVGFSPYKYRNFIPSNGMLTYEDFVDRPDKGTITFMRGKDIGKFFRPKIYKGYQGLDTTEARKDLFNSLFNCMDKNRKVTLNSNTSMIGVGTSNWNLWVYYYTPGGRQQSWNSGSGKFEGIFKFNFVIVKNSSGEIDVDRSVLGIGKNYTTRFVPPSAYLDPNSTIEITSGHDLRATLLVGIPDGYTVEIYTEMKPDIDQNTINYILLKNYYIPRAVDILNYHLNENGFEPKNLAKFAISQQNLLNFLVKSDGTPLFQSIEELRNFIRDNRTNSTTSETIYPSTDCLFLAKYKTSDCLIATGYRSSNDPVGTSDKSEEDIKFNEKFKLYRSYSSSRNISIYNYRKDLEIWPYTILFIPASSDRRKIRVGYSLSYEVTLDYKFESGKDPVIFSYDPLIKYNDENNLLGEAGNYKFTIYCDGNNFGIIIPYFGRTSSPNDIYVYDVDKTGNLLDSLSIGYTKESVEKNTNMTRPSGSTLYKIIEDSGVRNIYPIKLGTIKLKALGQKTITLSTVETHATFAPVVYQEVWIHNGEITKYGSFYLKGFLDDYALGVTDGAAHIALPFPNDVEFDMLFCSSYSFYARPKKGQSNKGGVSGSLDNYIWAMGSNVYKQINSSNDSIIKQPISIRLDGRVKKFVGFSSGDNNNQGIYILTENSKCLYFAGYNGYGQSGNGGTAQVNGIQKLTNVSNPENIFASSLAGFVVTSNGRLYAAGWNGQGNLGTGDTSLKNTWTEIMRDIQDINSVHVSSNYESHSRDYAGTMLSVDGKLYGFGYNGSSNILPGTTSDQLSPIRVQDFKGDFIDAPSGTKFVRHPLETVILVPNIYNDVTYLYTGGNGIYGHGDTRSSNSAINKIKDLPGLDWDILTNFSPFSFGDRIECFVVYSKSRQEAYAWGSNYRGELGVGTKGNISQMMPVLFPHKASYQFELQFQFDGGSDFGGLVCIIDGQLYAVGYSGYQRLPVDTSIFTLIPTT